MFKGIREDIATVKAKDVAATSTLNILLNSTGMRAIWRYRRHHWLWNHGFKALARFLATRSRRRFGVEIHPAAQIGRRFMIDHGMGVVIGETTIIGDDCLLYQGVTLGGTGKEEGKRHPTLGNRVIVGVGACVLGDIYLADDVKVGGGAVVVKDVHEACTLVGVPAHAAPSSWSLDEKLDERCCRQELLPDPLEDQIEILQSEVETLKQELSSLRQAIAEK